MFDKKDQITDDIADDVRPYLDALTTRTAWNSKARSSLESLKKILREKNYKLFVGHPGRYHLTGIGSSCLYDVPPNRRGFLSDFRGKRIRVVCVSSGRYDRELMAGVVGVTPPHLIRKRETPIYIFPKIDDHEVVYRGRRYMLIKAAGAAAIELHLASFEEIDLKACDFVLIDGEGCSPIAILKYADDKSLVGILIGGWYWESFEKISDAIRVMAKKAARFRAAVVK